MFGRRNPLTEIPALAAAQENYVLECRRTVHRFAETAGNERKTSDFIRAEAEKLGLPVETVSRTGLLVTLDTGRNGNGVALRADMDALPVKENPRNVKRARTVLSENPETSHACGHDCHVAMLLGAMRLLCEMKKSLSGRIYFCFEEGEEIGSGWDGMLEVLAARDVNTVFGLHVYSALEHGLVSIEAGPRMAGTINVNATFVGKGGHGSRPDLSVNPVYAAASAICNLSVAATNQLDANETVTLGITGISCGNSGNVIPDTATVLGTLRFFNPEEGRKAVRLLHSVFDNTARMNRCTVDYMMTDIVLQPVINDPEASGMLAEALGRTLPTGSLAQVDRWYASESFSQYLRRYRGVLAFLGVRNEELGCCAEHHNECFDVDESALVRGVVCHASYAVSALADARVAGWTCSEVKDEEYGEESAETPASKMPEEAFPAEASAPERTAPAKTARYTLDTKIGVLLKSEGAKTAVSSVVDGLVNHPQIGFAKGMTIRKASRFIPTVLTPEMMEKIEAALAAVED